VLWYRELLHVAAEERAVLLRRVEGVLERAAELIRCERAGDVSGTSRAGQGGDGCGCLGHLQPHRTGPDRVGPPKGTAEWPENVKFRSGSAFPRMGGLPA
jgi:hypothetical protein